MAADGVDQASAPNVWDGRLGLDDRGWLRFVPTAGAIIIRTLHDQGPMTRAQLAVHMGEDDDDLGWAAPAWGESEEFTDEELAELNQQFAFGGLPQSAEEANAEEAALRAEQTAKIDSFAQGVGVGALRTAEDVLTYLLAARVVIASNEHERGDEQVHYALNPEAPAPGEVLAISAQDQATEERIAWHGLHGRTAQDILATFDSRIPGPTQSRKTTLQRLGREIGVDAEAARAGVMCLLLDGDFTTTIDIERAETHKVFELVVDWETYATTRAVPSL